MIEFRCNWIKNGKVEVSSIYEAYSLCDAKKKADYYMRCNPNKYDRYEIY